MPPVFSPQSNLYARGGLLVVLVLAAGAIWVAFAYGRAPYATGADLFVPQPVPFSHAHHVGGLGIDCRYCHASVEVSSFAGIPPTATCMSCHAQLWTDAGILAPIRRSFETDTPIRWNRVYDLPDFVFFDHSIHVAKGVGCETCHGRVDRLPLMKPVQALHMKWCLGCHRDPAPNLRPRDEVFTMGWRPDGDREALGKELMERNSVQTRGLTSCSTCHR